MISGKMDVLSWENQRKTIGKYGGVNGNYIAIENDHRHSGFSH